MKRVTELTIYKFMHNLVTEPGAFAAFKSFVFRFRKNGTEAYLTAEEAEVANMRSAIFLTSANVLTLTSTLEAIAYNTQWGLTPAQFQQLSFLASSYNSSLGFKKIISAAVLHYPSLYYIKGLLRTDNALLSDKIAFGMSILAADFLVIAFLIKCMLAVSTIKSTTPLHRAALAGDQEKFRDLVRRGAKLTLRDADNRTVIELLNPSSELIAEFNLNNLEYVDDNDAESITLAFLNRVSNFCHSGMLNLATNLRRVLPHNFLNRSSFNGETGTFAELQRAVINNDFATVHELLVTDDLKNLTMAQQTKLFALSSTIKMQATLISMGLDFRDYLYRLHVDRQELKNNSISSLNNELRVAALNLLLPNLDTRHSVKTAHDPILDQQFEQNFNCPITRDLPSTPVKIGNHKYDFPALLNAWGTRRINPLSNLPCATTDVSFDLQTFTAINRVYPTKTASFARKKLNSLTTDIKNQTSFSSYLGSQVIKILDTGGQVVSFDQVLGLAPPLLMNYMPLGARAIGVIGSYPTVANTIVFLYLANRIKRNARENLFNDRFLSEILGSIIFGVVLYGFINRCAKSTHQYNTSMYTHISIRESNNLDIPFLNHNMHKFEVVYDPNAAWANVFDLGYLANQYIYIFVCMLVAHCFNFVINSPVCFSDYETYDFQPVEPTSILSKRARPMTFWKDLKQSDLEKGEPAVLPPAAAARPELR